MSEFLQSISSEKDLEPYENYLQRNRNIGLKKENVYTPTQLKYGLYMPSFLSGFIGKTVKIESIIGNKLDVKAGVLTTVGTGFVVIREYRTNNTVICDINTIKYVTVIGH